MSTYANSGHAYARTAGDRCQERGCWREVVLERGGAGDGGAISWFLPKRGTIAVGITKVEYIALSEARNLM